MRRRRFGLIVAPILAAVAASSWPGAVLAECSFVPPWPKITDAIPSARQVVVGEVVADFSQADLHLGPGQIARDYALRVTEVLRGPATAGDLIEVQYLLPNWPWTNVAEGDETFASCTNLQTSPGEVIAIAFDALQPGGTMRTVDGEWNQPPTRYNAMAVIVPGPAAALWPDRQQLTIEQLRNLASLPPTDTALSAEPAVTASHVLLAAAVLGFVIGWRRFGGSRQRSAAERSDRR